MLPADLGDRAALARVEDLLREDASITLLVNNAGIGTHTPLLQSDVEQMTRMVDLNVTAPMRLAYAVAPAFVARGRGAIINIASIVAIAPELLNGVYGGSKAFVLAFSQSLRHELAAAGVQVQAVLPGATATDFWAIGGRPVENLDPRIVMRAEAWWTRRCWASSVARRSPSLAACRREMGRLRRRAPGHGWPAVQQYRCAALCGSPLT